MGYGVVKVGLRSYATLSHLIEGDWRKHHVANKELLYVIEPVIESLIQLLVQSILVYIVLGPSDSVDGNNSGVNFKGLSNTF